MVNGHKKTKIKMTMLTEEPAMSDRTILITVEDLIDRAMGPPDANIVNFKIIQMILEILARQLRILQQKIEIQVIDLKEEQMKTKEALSALESSLSISPPVAVEHERKSPQRHKTKDGEQKTFEKKASFDSVGIKLNVQADKKEKVDKKEQMEAGNEDEGLLEKEEMREKGELEEQKILIEEEQEEMQYEMAEKISQVEQNILSRDMIVEKISKSEMESSEGRKKEIRIQKTTGKSAQKEERLEEAEMIEQTKEEEQLISMKIEEEVVEMDLQKERVISKKTSEGTRMEITEKQIDNEKILVVEKGPFTRSDTVTESPSGIDFVTPSQLEILEEAIEMLRNLVPPKPVLPGNEKLISDIMEGTVTLPEAMETLQVEERMKSAEASVANLVEMLTQLASVGALPEEIAVQVENIIPPSYKEAGQTPPIVEKKSGAIDSKAIESQPTQSQATLSQATRSQATRSSDSRPFDTPGPSEAPAETPKQPTVSRSSMASSTLRVPCVTYKDMRSHLKVLKDDITKILNIMLGKITEMTDTAQHINKGVADKLGVAQKLDSRITALHSMLVEYDSMFTGLTPVLMTQILPLVRNAVPAEKNQQETRQLLFSKQLQNIEDKISQNCDIMKSGLARLSEVNNNAEATAIMEMLARSEEMDTELCCVLHKHKLMMATRKEFSEQSRSLLDCIEVMRKEKADRDYVLDGLKAKADNSQLAGRLKYMDFVAANTHFKCRIDQCHERFDRSIALWAKLIKDLKNTKDTKVDFIDLLLERDTVERRLKILNNKIRILSAVLGDPEIAQTTRQMALDATCGSCHESALMEPIDASSGMPPRLPALRRAPAAATRLRIPELVRPGPMENRHHHCHRWCGGSHTLAVDPTKLIQVHVQMQAIPTRKYTGYGEDERLYMFEEELQPCVECNALGGENIQDPLPDLSSRDTGETSMSNEPKPSTKCSCPLIK